MNRVTIFGAITMALALAFGNFLYQAMLDAPSWSTAAERSFFQAVAILCAWNAWRHREPKATRRGVGPGLCD